MYTKVLNSSFGDETFFWNTEIVNSFYQTDKKEFGKSKRQFGAWTGFLYVGKNGWQNQKNQAWTAFLHDVLIEWSVWNKLNVDLNFFKFRGKVQIKGLLSDVQKSFLDS